LASNAASDAHVCRRLGVTGAGRKFVGRDRDDLYPLGKISDEPGCCGDRIAVSADDDPLRISQYVYFALESETVSAAAITARLGVEPDSNVASPTVPTMRDVSPGRTLRAPAPGLAGPPQVRARQRLVRPGVPRSREPGRARTPKMV
jgi:hypothetical protein